MAAFAFNLGSSLLSFGLGAKHKKAVAKENNVLGGAIPAGQAGLDAAAQAVQSGQMSVSDAGKKLEQIYQEFEASVAGIIKRSGEAGKQGKGTDPSGKWYPGKCNEACGQAANLRKAIDELKTKLPGLLPVAQAAPEGAKESPGLLSQLRSAFTGSAQAASPSNAERAAMGLPGAPAQSFFQRPEVLGALTVLVPGGILFLLFLAVMRASRGPRRS